MDSHLLFIVWWLVTTLIALPFEVVYLVSNTKSLSSVARVFYKVLPVLIFTISLLISLAAGIGQRTVYSGFIIGVLAAYFAGDFSLALSDIASEHKAKRDAYVWRLFGILAFSAGHVLLLVALCISPKLSAGLDQGPVAPAFFLLLIPFGFACLLLFAFLIYLHKLSCAEVTVIGIYGLLLGAVSWRAAARIGTNLNSEYISSQILALTAMLVFSLSDFAILIDMYLYRNNWSKLWTMTLYWAAVTMLYVSSFLFKT